MSQAWKFSTSCSRAEAEQAQAVGFEATLWHDDPVLVASENTDAANSEAEWRLDAYFDSEPDAHDLTNLYQLVASEASWFSAPIEDDDWVTLSQTGLEPVVAGRFVIQTGQDEPVTSTGDLHPLTIPASLAFGTGHHETTSGCLEMLSHLHERGQRFRSVMDIGTGTGLLAIASHKLWPTARLTASDLDPNCASIVAENCARNGVPPGLAAGQLSFCVANGTDAPLIRKRKPFDLILANILAGPLSIMAPSIGEIARPGSLLVLAGMIDSQVSQVTRAYLGAGFATFRRLQRNEWTILLLRKRDTYGFRRPHRVRRQHRSAHGFGEW